MTLSTELGRIVHGKLLLGGGSRPQHSSSLGAVLVVLINGLSMWVGQGDQRWPQRFRLEWLEPLPESLPGLQLLLASGKAGGYGERTYSWGSEPLELTWALVPSVAPALGLTSRQNLLRGRCENKCMLDRLHLQNGKVVWTPFEGNHENHTRNNITSSSMKTWGSLLLHPHISPSLFMDAELCDKHITSHVPEPGFKRAQAITLISQ